MSVHDVLSKEVCEKFAYESNYGKAGREVAKQLREIVNSTEDRAAFMLTIANEHPTHQQQVMGLIRQYIALTAELFDEGRFDLRNQAAGEFAVKVRDVLHPTREGEKGFIPGRFILI